jgi:hypothetical protein
MPAIRRNNKIFKKGAHARRLDLLQLQCRAWMGRLAAVVYVPLLAGAAQSWEPRLHGRRVRSLLQTLSRFYDSLDPMSALLPLSYIAFPAQSVDFLEIGCLLISWKSAACACSLCMQRVSRTVGKRERGEKRERRRERKELRRREERRKNEEEGAC